jgi:hypothetical protein
MEDFNEPSEERVGLLKRLEDAMRLKGVTGREAEEREEGTVPPHFWAACQICDIKALDKFVDYAYEHPRRARILAAQTRPMVQFCKYNILNLFSLLLRSLPSLCNSCHTANRGPRFLYLFFFRRKSRLIVLRGTAYCPAFNSPRIRSLEY